MKPKDTSPPKESTRIIPATAPAELTQVRGLFCEYESFLGVDLGFQSFEEELANLPGRYADPDGVLYLALVDNTPAGCVALRKLARDSCEMKRLFVKSEFRSRGLGRILAEQAIAAAKIRGYKLMRLDTLNTLDPANRLYASLGFTQSAPYYANPLPGVVYWERAL